MKLAVINGSTRRGSTWNSMDLIRQELKKYAEVESKEFFLPDAMPHFCAGCFSCFFNGEDKCPHSEAVRSIADAILEADLIILTSPVYALDVSGQMKALLDHLCYMWLSHRPDPKMFNKIGLTVTTTAGAGLRHASKTLRNSLKFWGVKKVFTVKHAVAAAKWSGVPEKNKSRIKKNAEKTAKKIAQAVKNADRLPNPLFRSFMFGMVIRAMKKYDWGERDISHWKAQGWLDGKKPF